MTTRMMLLLLVAAILRAIDDWHHRDADRVLGSLRLKPHVSSDNSDKSYYRSSDSLFAVLPFVWAWAEIGAALTLASQSGSLLAYLVLGLFVGTRFRCLHEFSHIGVHRGLCRSVRWQYVVGNVFAQYSCFRPSMARRYVSHVKEHHLHPNELGCDPNIARLIAIGVRPGITESGFYLKLVHPLTPSGLLETTRSMARNVAANDNAGGVITRLSVVALTAAVIFKGFGLPGLIAGYIVPLIAWYPFFSWISLLVEHRWFVGCDATNRRDRECINGRPTAYSGFLGWLIRQSISPATDSYHLAHSLYPHVRWNYMRAVDEALRAKYPAYTRYGSDGLLFRTTTRHSALSELRDRLTLRAEHGDLAEWAAPLAPMRPTAAMGHASGEPS